MRVLASIAVLACLAATVNCFSFYNVIKEEWDAFKTTHGKIYTEVEEMFRIKVFAENKQFIAKHNQLYEKGLKSFKLKMNHFGDLMHHEFVAMMNGWAGKRLNKNTIYESSKYMAPDHEVVLPKEVDWREKGAVTPVKDQGQCGSCWAFSATGSLEGQHFRKTGKLVSLSEQNLVDCSGGRFGNQGCNGGLMNIAFQYIKANGGIDTEVSYPYVAETDPCHFRNDTIGADDTGHMDIDVGDEKQLKAAVATVGPVSVAIDAGHQSFQFYHSGIYNEPACEEDNLDHGVLVVGYGTQEGEDYWIVKNSWNTTWGDKGYIYMARNKKNMCGIASSASYPLV